MDSRPYRDCVVGVFVDKNGQVLVGQRSDSFSWQFPQGGVDKNESEEQALRREMREEIGCDSFTIVEKSPELVSYEFPKNLRSSIAKKFRGQQQRWFHCRFDGENSFDLKKATSHEFVNIKWVEISYIQDKVVEWKADTYRKALTLLKISSVRSSQDA